MRVSIRGIAVVAVVAALFGQGDIALSQVPAAPKAVWTASSDAPKDLLTALEGERHDRFIARARAGDLDLVFFGTTDTEMWMWPDRGLPVWNRVFGPMKAADFGSQGTRFESLTWRMRNGELDGYRAKLIVLQASGDDEVVIRDGKFDDHVAKYASIIAEIRARQPQARILLFGFFPRSETHTASGANAALSKLANNETVFFVDMSSRFFRADGSHKTEMWRMSGPPDAGIQTPAFEVWAEVLQPWLDRFVR